MTMLKRMIKVAIAIMLVVLFSMPADAKAANYSCCKCSCTCNCTCDCNCNKNCNTGNQVQPAAEKEKAVMAETKRVTDAHMQEDNRKQYSGYMMQLADTLESSAKNSGFTVTTKSWRANGGDYNVVQQEFSRNG